MHQRRAARSQLAFGGAHAGPGQPSRPIALSRVNTNLEDISDWLTKTIIGVGLTQLYNMPPFALHVARVLNDRGLQWRDGGEAFVLMVLIYFGVGGFWLGYVGTRTVLTKLFDAVDGSGAGDATGSALERYEGARLDLAGRGIAAATDRQTEATDCLLLRLPRQSVKSVTELAAWASAHARAHNYGMAAAALEQVARLVPGEAVKQQLAAVYTAAGRFADSDFLLRDAPLNEVVLANALAEAPPRGFSKAADIGEKMLTTQGDVGTVRLHAWLAKAYGQEHAYLTLMETDPAKLEATRAKVVREVAATVSDEPAMKAPLREAWDPSGGASRRGDLASIDAADPDLTKLLG